MDVSEASETPELAVKEFDVITGGDLGGAAAKMLYFSHPIPPEYPEWVKRTNCSSPRQSRDS